MKRIFALLLAMCLFLCACGGTVQTPAETPPATTEAAVVTTVDEFLAALKPGAEIVLGEGEFRLESASDYGETKGPYYIWNDLGDGQYGLQLQYLDDVVIRGAGWEKTGLIAAPRWANVLTLQDCRNVTLQDMNLGHRTMTEACEGGVLALVNCEDTTLQGLGLYGCGTVGVLASRCQGLTMEDCTVYDCSICGVQLGSCQDVRIQDSSFHHLGKDMPVEGVFTMWDCSNVAVQGCTVSDNYIHRIIDAQGSDICFENNHFQSNQVVKAAFTLNSDDIILEQNTFEDIDLRSWYAPESYQAVDRAGNPVIFEDPVTESMPVGTATATPVSTGEQKEVRVYNTDGFLKAIAPNTRILLETSLLDLSKAKDYGTGTTEYYSWEEAYDGFSLVIHGVDNLTIVAEDGDRTTHTISAVPRYANVLTFRNCSAITLQGFTAGHTIEPGYCTGGVFQFQNSSSILVENCGMFGCGTMGIQAMDCENIQVVNSEIYECSITGISLDACDNVTIAGTLIRDIGDEYAGDGPFFIFYGSRNITLDGAPIDGNYTGR